MNIHEHQAKQILKQFGATIPEGVFGFTVEELLEKCKSLKTEKYVLKAQIHAGGRGKAGGVKILDNLDELEKSAKELLGKKLVTHQTGPEGKEVKRLYVEACSNIENELLEDGFKRGIEYEIMLVPNIVNITYGRGVGYTFEEEVFDKSITEISATKIRKKLREEGKL